MVSSPADISLPETFHRAKRTVMTIGSAVIVLAVSGYHGEIKSPMLGSDIAFPLNLVIYLGAGVTGYYFWGFWLEFQTARRINSHFAIDTAGRRIDLALEDLNHRLQQRAAKVIQEFDQATQARTESERSAFAVFNPSLDSFYQSLKNDLAEERQSRLYKLNERVERYMRESPPNIAAAEDARASFDEDFLARVHDRLHEQLAAISKQLERLDGGRAAAEAAMARAAEGMTALSEELDRSRREMLRVSEAIGQSRRAQFWWWELGGATCMMVATLVAAAVTAWGQWVAI